MSKKNKHIIGNKYWRSLNELAETPEFKQRLKDEFPDGLFDKEKRKLSRRNFLGLIGASVALAGLAGCRKPIEKIVPYVNPPEEIIPGIANYYATSMPFKTSAYGLIVECHEGRPTKIEGNPEHPSSMGAANIFMQASILNLYDPDRSKKILHDGTEKDWDQFVAWWRNRRDKYLVNQGEGLAILTESYSSPTLARLTDQFNKQFPKAKVVAWEPSEQVNRLDYFRRKGQNYSLSYNIEKAKIILSLDSDFLQNDPENIRHAKGFANGRKLQSPSDNMNRLYVAESNYTLTGAMADHRMKLPSSMIPSLLASLALRLKITGLDINLSDSFVNAFSANDFDKTWLYSIADDLMKNRSESLIIVGQSAGEKARALGLAINEALGNFGQTLVFAESEDVLESDIGTFADFVKNIDRTETLIIIGSNPAYNAPADYEFDKLLNNIPDTVHLSEDYNETSEACHWYLNRTHYLESWGDVRAINGTAGIIQPMISPMYNGKSDVELWHLLASGESGRGYDIVKDTWRDIIKGGNFEKLWEKVLHDGLLLNTEFTAVTPQINRNDISKLDANDFAASRPTARTPEAILYNSPILHDGRYANNGWLQELPDPITKLTWDNAALVNIKTARELGLKNGDVVRLRSGKEKIEIPIWIQPGLADYTLAIALGYGRRRSGKIGTDVGVNGYNLLNSNSGFVLQNVEISKTGKSYNLANTQDHSAMEGRAIVREASLDDYRADPGFALKMVEHPPLKSIFTEHKYDKGYQWGMTIDLNACIGCGACTIACQSENNIPVVGKDRVFEGREMHWLRNDRYFTGEPDNPGVVIQPMPCQQCENAPCETVCPVAATVHDGEGLNSMTYNRCIGTRYCSNNCPYKVRRFNFFNYTKDMPEVMKMVQNPDVTVRFRGVMEKCTFCIQRINRSKQKAKKDNRTVRDGEIQTACQQTCPAKAITFGNINDPDSMVSSKKKIDRNYALLAEFNMKPRNSFLAKIRNPHPDLITEKSDMEEG